MLGVFALAPRAEAEPRVDYSISSKAEAAKAVDIEPVLWAMSYKGVEDVNAIWVKCDQVNAFYFPELRSVVMCDELLDMPPAFIRWVAAHEMAHAVIRTRNVPIPGSQETAADDLATLTLLWTGHEDEVIAAAQTMMEYAEGRPLNPADPHGHWAQRAYRALCLAVGEADMDADDCVNDYRRATWAWNVLLDS